MHIDTSSRKEQRKFGLVMAVAITAIGLFRWWLHGYGPLPMRFFYVAAAFLVLGVIAPQLLRPVFIVWMKFSLAMNWVMTRVLLTVAFFLLILPTRLILIVARKDVLNRSWDPEAASYWEEAEDQPKEFDRYLNQF